ncbi:MAG TPA: phosphate ABC transporter substrate-binding protein [Chloroflexi bacterium]|nr:phosphate ABC transporter substrate-binding protein [Chloroflexota bacterium]
MGLVRSGERRTLIPRQSRHCLLIPLLLFLVAGCAPAGPPETVTSITITNVGSDTMVNLALAWAEAYHDLYPHVSISVTGGGSGTGIAAMINGSTDIANASREMQQEEFDQALRRGIEPMPHVVALDAIAVVVNPHNPLDGLTITEISDVFTGGIVNWSELGGEDRPIVLASRESNSGTYMYFLEKVVRQDDPQSFALFSPEALLLPSSEIIGLEVATNPNAIGYDGLGYVTPEQKTLKVAVGGAGPYVSPTIETVRDGTYPIARPLYMYTSGEPTGEIEEYLDWIMSEDGQRIVAELGFVPLSGF